MKKTFRILALGLIMAAALAGCAEPPELDLEALGWDESWQTVGTVAAVEVPEGFTAAKNLDIMSGEGLWYADWTHGEGVSIKNDVGEDATLYEAHIYLLIERCSNPAKAQAETKLWAEKQEGSYTCSEPKTATYGGVDYTVRTLTAREDNPFDGGISAAATCGSYAVSVELMYQDSFTGADDTMDEFLSGLHLNLEEA